MRIAILSDSNLTDHNSLTTVIRGQVAMLTRHGHDVTVFTEEDFPHDRKFLPPGLNPKIKAVIHKASLKRYKHLDELSTEDYETANLIADMLIFCLADFDIVFTHDWIFRERYLIYAEALRLAADHTRHIPFLHWRHSTPFIKRDWWDINRYGPNHRIVFPNSANRQHVAEKYNADINDIQVVPHVVDLRILFEFDPITCHIIDQFPTLLEADFVQVYPAAADRLRHKGLRALILIFKTLKRRGISVCLLIVDYWSGNRERQDDAEYRKMARRNLLMPDEFAFTSRIKPPEGYWPFENGVPQRVLRELMMLSDIFCFPTHGESCGLTYPETILAGGALPVLNGSLSVLREVSGDWGLFPEFGSWERKSPADNEKEYFDRLAKLIIAHREQDQAIQARKHIIRTYNMDTIYREYYAPLLAESQMWVQKEAC